MRDRVVVSAEIDDDLVEVLMSTDLPPNWQDRPAPRSTQALGDAWVASGRTAVLRVPRVVVPEQPDVLLNPAHLDFGRIRIGAPTALVLDPGLRQSRRRPSRTKGPPHRRARPSARDCGRPHSSSSLFWPRAPAVGEHVLSTNLSGMLYRSASWCLHRSWTSAPDPRSSHYRYASVKRSRLIGHSLALSGAAALGACSSTASDDLDGSALGEIDTGLSVAAAFVGAVTEEACVLSDGSEQTC